MATSHTFLATSRDTKIIIDWFCEAGALAVGACLPEAECPSDGREYVLHFPAIGPLEFWPDEINLSDYPENSKRWRKAVIIRYHQEENPQKRQIDADRSAAAGLKLPELRDNRYWVSGCVWFPGSKLRETFPELSRICQRFERFMRKFPKVFDNTKGSDYLPFDFQLCMSGIIQSVVALPEAYAMLDRESIRLNSSHCQ